MPVALWIFMEKPSFAEPLRSPAGLADSIRLRAAIKSRDTWWPTVFSGPVANWMVGRLAPIEGIHPNHITALGMLVAILAGACFSIGSYRSLVAGGILIQLVFTLDCADGQLARYRRLTSPFGEVFDRVLDRIKPLLYALTLAAGADGQSPDPLLWIGAAITGFAPALVYDVYGPQYRLLAAQGPMRRTEAPRQRLSLPLRALDLPFLRPFCSDHYVLISALCFLDQPRLLMLLLAIPATIQVLFRPLYYVAVLRRDTGIWPWHFHGSPCS